MQRYTVDSYTVVMKALLLLSLLLLSAGTSKAEAPAAKRAYFYGTVYGAGIILCTTVTMGELKKDIAQQTLDYFVKQMVSDPSAGDVADSIKLAYKEVKEESSCKGVY